MRSTYLFNHHWLYRPQQADSSIPDDMFEPIVIPHTNKVLPYHNFDDLEYQFISTYRKLFTLPEAPAGRRVYLDFAGAMLAATVTINDHTFEEQKGGYTPFSFDITDYINADGDNTVTVHLDSTERTDIPPFGFVVDYLTFGGIYRDVHLRYVEPVHIENYFIRPQNVLTNSPTVEVDVHLHNQSDASGQYTLALKIADSIGEGIQSTTAQVEVAPGQQVTPVKFDALSDISLWSINNPTLYHLEITLIDSTDTVIDAQTTRFGFREAVFKDDGFYLNGEPLQLFGLNRHQTYPYIGAAASARLQRKDADILKYELSCNIVRTSHYPQSVDFLDRCDEIGLLVFEEIPGWQHIGDEAWQEISLRDVRAMIERDWNHPSIILWGVRINESFDNTEFYQATNALAHELDPTRQTTGVRFWQYSEFLEDVYGYNDFSNGIEEPVQTPHLVTEFNGHMFPTKSWDNEERRVEHALRHARIHAQQMSMGGVSGAIGWCAFDYNTHKQFGSGDRICYHGVMDMFRLPKWAAYFYQSQVMPQQQVILQVATMWTMGDRSEGGNNPVMVFSNCDEIEAFLGERSLGRFQPQREDYPNLTYPPFKIELETTWGTAFEALRVVGYVEGTQVAEQQLPTDKQVHALLLELDDTELYADGMDMTRLTFKVVDAFGNMLPYAVPVVTFSIEGPADLIGDNPFPLIGGQAALYIRTHQTAGTVTIKAEAARIDPAQVTLMTVEPPNATSHR